MKQTGIVKTAKDYNQELNKHFYKAQNVIEPSQSFPIDSIYIDSQILELKAIPNVKP